MPETRYITEYDNQGNAIIRIPYEVSDEELYFEGLQHKVNETHMALMQAYRNFDSLTAAQVKQVVKALLQAYLVGEKDWYLSVV